MRIGGIVAVLLATMALTGCTDIQKWTYQPDARTVRTPILAKRVVVPPLNDLRPHVNRDMTLVLTAIVPLLPYGTAEYHRPERLPIWEMKGVTPSDPPHDVAKAIAEELDHSGLFSKVVYSPTGEAGELVLKGDLIALKDERWQTLYGLTLFFGDLLWLAGAPKGGTSQELTLKLALVETGTGRTLWSQTFSERDKKTEWVYAMRFALRHPQLLKTEMRQAVASLEKTLSQ